MPLLVITNAHRRSRPVPSRPLRLLPSSHAPPIPRRRVVQRVSRTTLASCAANLNSMGRTCVRVCVLLPVATARTSPLPPRPSPSSLQLLRRALRFSVPTRSHPAPCHKCRDSLVGVAGMGGGNAWGKEKGGGGLGGLPREPHANLTGSSGAGQACASNVAARLSLPHPRHALSCFLFLLSRSPPS